MDLYALILKVVGRTVGSEHCTGTACSARSAFTRRVKQQPNDVIEGHGSLGIEDQMCDVTWQAWAFVLHVAVVCMWCRSQMQLANSARRAVADHCICRWCALSLVQRCAPATLVLLRQVVY